MEFRINIYSIVSQQLNDRNGNGMDSILPFFIKEISNQEMYIMSILILRKLLFKLNHKFNLHCMVNENPREL